MKSPLYKISRASLRLHSVQNALTIVVMALAVALVVVGGVVISTSNSGELDRFPHYGEMHFTYLDAQADSMDTIRNLVPVERVGTLRTVARVRARGDLQRGLSVGCADAEALALEHIGVAQGRLPQAQGEIAMPQSMLYRLGLSQKPGDVLSLPLYSTKDNTAMDMEFTLCGIIEDYSAIRNQGFYTDEYNADAYEVLQAHIEAGHPSALVSTADADAIYKDFGAQIVSYPFKLTAGTDLRGAYLALMDGLSDDQRARCALNGYGYYPSLRESDFFDWFRSVDVYNAAFPALLAILVALAVGGGIAAAFEVRLTKKRQQLGVLHAIGASKRQAAFIALGEALPLALVSLPIGVGLGLLLSQWGFSVVGGILQTEPVMTVSAAPMIPGIALCLVVMLLFSARPSLKVYKLSPVDAMRETTPKANRRALHRPARASKAPIQWLLIWRALGAHKGRVLLPVISLAACIALALFSCSFIAQWNDSTQTRLARPTDTITVDVRRTLTSGEQDGLPIIVLNDIASLPSINERDIGQAVLMPGVLDYQVKRKHPGIALLLNDAQMGNYARFIDDLNFDEITDTRSDERAQQRQDERAQRRASRLAAVKQLGYPEDKTLVIPISFGEGDGLVALNDAGLLALEADLIDGEIDLEKLKSGEQIILGASNVEYTVQQGGVSYGATRRTQGKNVVVNDSFKVGEAITFATQYQGGEGEFASKAVIQTAIIGAIVDHYSVGTVFAADQAYQNWGFIGGISELVVQVDLGVGYADVFTGLSILAEQNNAYFDSEREWAISDARSTAGTSFILMAPLALISLISLMQLISNAVNKLKGRTRELSLLRAVGMDTQGLKKLLYRESMVEGLLASLLGVLLGVALLGVALSNQFAYVPEFYDAFSREWIAQFFGLMPWAMLPAVLLVPSGVCLLVALGFVRRMDGTSIALGLRTIDT